MRSQMLHLLMLLLLLRGMKTRATNPIKPQPWPIPPSTASAVADKGYLKSSFSGVGFGGRIVVCGDTLAVLSNLQSKNVSATVPPSPLPPGIPPHLQSSPRVHFFSLNLSQETTVYFPATQQVYRHEEQSLVSLQSPSPLLLPHELASFGAALVLSTNGLAVSAPLSGKGGRVLVHLLNHVSPFDVTLESGATVLTASPGLANFGAALALQEGLLAVSADDVHRGSAVVCLFMSSLASTDTPSLVWTPVATLPLPVAEAVQSLSLFAVPRTSAASITSNTVALVVGTSSSASGEEVLLFVADDPDDDQESGLSMTLTQRLRAPSPDSVASGFGAQVAVSVLVYPDAQVAVHVAITQTRSESGESAVHLYDWTSESDSQSAQLLGLELQQSFYFPAAPDSGAGWVPQMQWYVEEVDGRSALLLLLAFPHAAAAHLLAGVIPDTQTLDVVDHPYAFHVTEQPWTFAVDSNANSNANMSTSESAPLAVNNNTATATANTSSTTSSTISDTTSASTSAAANTTTTSSSSSSAAAPTNASSSTADIGPSIALNATSGTTAASAAAANITSASSTTATNTSSSSFGATDSASSSTNTSTSTSTSTASSSSDTTSATDTATAAFDAVSALDMFSAVDLQFVRRLRSVSVAYLSESAQPLQRTRLQRRFSLLPQATLTAKNFTQDPDPDFAAALGLWTSGTQGAQILLSSPGAQSLGVVWRVSDLMRQSAEFALSQSQTDPEPQTQAQPDTEDVSRFWVTMVFLGFVPSAVVVVAVGLFLRRVHNASPTAYDALGTNLAHLTPTGGDKGKVKRRVWQSLVGSSAGAVPASVADDSAAARASPPEPSFSESNPLHAQAQSRWSRRWQRLHQHDPQITDSGTPSQA